MFNIVLYQPEIPPNTGNIIRLAANTGATLHLVEPLGFNLEDRELKRAGLDYHEYAELKCHASWPAFLAAEQTAPERMFALTTRATRLVHEVQFAPGDWLVFGAETRGLSEAVRQSFAATQNIKLPMIAGQRSLNLSNAVAVTVFEAWRQNQFGL